MTFLGHGTVALPEVTDVAPAGICQEGRVPASDNGEFVAPNSPRQKVAGGAHYYPLFNPPTAGPLYIRDQNSVSHFPVYTYMTLNKVSHKWLWLIWYAFCWPEYVSIYKLYCSHLKSLRRSREILRHLRVLGCLSYLCRSAHCDCGEGVVSTGH